MNTDYDYVRLNIFIGKAHIPIYHSKISNPSTKLITNNMFTYGSLEENISNNLNESSVHDLLINYEISKKITPPAICMSAYISASMYSRAVNGNTSKETLLKIGIALKLNINQVQELLDLAGFALTERKKEDLIIAYCFDKKIYDFEIINDYFQRHSLPLFVKLENDDDD
ncbi:MAG TPA: hypothetical protein VEF53_02330 [Patescibacteria group bacterium]|nr:hypothetical protein [Patescibacteria group bacterium]